MDNKIAKKGITLYTAKFVGYKKDGYILNEVYLIKIRRLGADNFQLQKKNGDNIIVYQSAEELKADWDSLHKVGIMDH